MAVYRRYTTRKKIPWGFILWAIFILTVFALTALLGHYLGEKAKDKEVLYTGQPENNLSDSSLVPLSEKSLHGLYCEPSEIASFISEDADTWASTWIYKDGAATFATSTDEKLLRDVSSLPPLSSFDIEAGTIGLFEVSSLYADEQVKSILTEYELSLLNEYSASSLDEIVLVFESVDEENYDGVFEFAGNVKGASVICVPYSILGNDAFFAKADERRVSLAIKADDVSAEQLQSDIVRYGFYFTKHNLRLVLSGDNTALADVLKENTLLNYQFYSPWEETK